ncbi:MAG: Mu transposase C-terminal domain-containing protein [Variovorax sp.]
MSTAIALYLVPGETLVIDGEAYEIDRVVDLQKCLCRHKQTGEPRLIDLRKNSVSTVRHRNVIDKATAQMMVPPTENELTQARARRSIIAPLMHGGQYGKKDAQQLVDKHAKSLATIYRWRQRYRDSGHLLTSLIDRVRDGGRGKPRLSPEVEKIIVDYIEGKFLSLQKPSIKASWESIGGQCLAAGYNPPALNTIRLRIAWIDDRVKLERRRGREEAIDKLDPNRGTIPNANHPLALGEMDHTLLPIIIVDDEHRLPMGRAWITVLIDVWSRVILGIRISLDAPSANSAGLCIAHGILTKDAWLTELGLEDEEWPFWGAPEILHMDNAQEFRSLSLQKVANKYGIDIQFRPAGTPRFGAHIERFMGTLSKHLNKAPGATFSGPEEKGEYDAEGNACLTSHELQRYLVKLIAKYHVTKHSALGMSPREKWREGITRPVDGILRDPPPIRMDHDRVRIEFLPTFPRTVQPHGVEIDNVVYYDDVLASFVGKKQNAMSRAGKQHDFHRDPRDISEIIFEHPETGQHFTIRSGLTPISIWEFKRARAKAQEDGAGDDVATTMRYAYELDQMTEAARTKTDRANKARTKAHKRAASSKPVTENTPRKQPKGIAPDYDASDVQAIDEDY